MRQAAWRLMVAGLILMGCAGGALADWQITDTWTRSSGAALHHEEVLYGGVVKCTVTPPSATTCSWTSTTLGGSVVIRSYNAQGAYSETAPLVVADVPPPATGQMLNVTYVAP